MRMKDIPEQERPQEKMLYYGAGALSTPELLALIIRTGNMEKSAVQLAEDVLAYSSGVDDSLGRAEVRELMNLEGIGVSKACSIVASMELARRISSADKKRRGVYVKSPEDAADLLMDEMCQEKQEHLVELLLNAKCEVESRVTVSVGELTSTTIHPRDVFRPAIRKSAAGIIVAHNHPSGDPTPSGDDIAATRRLMKAADVVGIPLLDHLIIGRTTYVSLKKEGYME